jgi:hypothetical protein
MMAIDPISAKASKTAAHAGLVCVDQSHFFPTALLLTDNCSTVKSGMRL